MTDFVRASTTLGDFEGEIVVTANDNEAKVFRGVPYARPPVGPLRFRKPQPLEEWSGVKQAKLWKPRCMQTLLFGPVVPPMQTDSEDCLYLNIYAPVQQTDEKVPVMVWFHGGFFSFGSAIEYGTDGAIDDLVGKSVVLVTVQYRLGPWGFFSTGDAAAKGNYGLWDQTAALQWIQDNIGAFGGDAQNVTLFGQGAGAVSIDALAISPHSQNLFHKAIQMAGSTFSPYAMLEKVPAYSIELARQLGNSRSETSSNSIVDFVRNKTSAEIAEALAQINPMTEDRVSLIKFGPRFDGDFFPQPLTVLRNLAPTKPTIIGNMENAGSVFTTPPFPLKFPFKPNDDFSAREFERFLKALVNGEKSANAEVMGRLACYYYLNSRDYQSKHRQFLAERWSEAYGDVQERMPTLQSAQAKLNAGWPTWLYSFDYHNPAAFPPDFKFAGPMDTMEMNYIFSFIALLPYEFNDDDHKLLNLVTTMWTNLAKFGNPSPVEESSPSCSWAPLSQRNASQYLSIKPNAHMKPAYNQSAAEFWLNLLPVIESLCKKAADLHF